jgi:FMN phosphatase YigB (HAD superfamily)
MRKPEPGIYHHTATRLGLTPEQCVFVDDLRPNIAGATGVGMVGVQFVTAEQAIEELETLFGLDLRLTTS